MVKFEPDTCFCILLIPDNPYNENRAIFKQQCRTHDTPAETFAHNRSFKPPKIIEDRIAEKKKPAFQRR